jgi:steroid delta-isomerase-like uncharacterized protein
MFLKSIFFCAAVLFVFSSFGQQSAMKIVKEKFDLMNKHETAKLAALYADSAVIESPNFDRVEKGVAGVMDAYSRYFKSTPNITYTITRIIPADSVIIVEYTSQGTIDSSATEVPDFMKGKNYTLKNCSILNISNGKISKDVSYFDQVSFLRQMGYFDKH